MLFFILNNGTVKGCGLNSNGQLGIGNKSNQVNIVDIPITGVKRISTGYAHTMFLMNDGTVKGCGFNNSGQLGINNSVEQINIIDIPIVGVKDVICGNYHTMFLMNDGTVKGCGLNTSGQLGIGNTTQQNSIVDIPITGVKEIFTKYDYTIFLMNDGTLKGCGRNSESQLAIGNTTNQSNIIDISLSNVKSVSCGTYHTMFLMNDGTVKGIGTNTSGQLGINSLTNRTTIVNTAISDVRQIYTGTAHTLFLMNDGTVKGCGTIAGGELGIGVIGGTIQGPINISKLPINRVKDIVIERGCSIFILYDGSIITCGTYATLWTVALRDVQIFTHFNNLANINNSKSDCRYMLKKNNIFYYYANNNWIKTTEINTEHPTVENMLKYGYPYIPSIERMPKRPYILYAYSEMNPDIDIITDVLYLEPFRYIATLNDVEIYNDEADSMENNITIFLNNLNIGSNIFKLIIYTSEVEKTFEYDIIKENDDTLLYKRRFLYDSTLGTANDITFESDKGIRIKDGILSSSIVLDIPTKKKASIKSISIDVDPDKNVSNTISTTMTLISENLHRETISIGKLSKLLNIKIT